MLVTKKIEIDMGHRVPNHKSKCRNFHGHRYIIEVGVDDKVVSTQGSSDEGMVIDFGDLKKAMMDVIDSEYDHAFCMYNEDPFSDYFRMIQKSNDQKVVFVDFIPTAENLAKHWYVLLEGVLLQRGININHVKVWETPNSTAIYTRADYETI